MASSEVGCVLIGRGFRGKVARRKAVRLAQFGFFAICVSGAMATGQVQASGSASSALSLQSTSTAIPALSQATIHAEWRRQTPNLSLAAVDTESAILAFGPLRYADGAMRVPGRTMPSLPPIEAEDNAKVGRSTSTPTAWKSSDGFDYLAVETATEEATDYGFDQLPLVSSAHAAAPDANSRSRRGDGVGGPMARLPIGGHMMFENGSADLGSETLAKLEMLVSTLKSSRSSVEIMAYAGRPSSKSSDDRRLALRRGLAVRAFLVARGIDQARISVRPMGGVRDSGPSSRADVFYVTG